jgi:dUTP pyrophosphatase
VFAVARGMKIAQLVIAPHARVEWSVTNSLESTLRGSGGFGSTGFGR